MTETDSSLSSDLLQQGLDTCFVGRQVHFYPLLDSTQEAAKEAALQEALEGAVFIADAQTAGRGRFGRAWHASPGSSLLMSVLLRPAAPLYPRLFMIASLTVMDAIRRVCGLESTLKWPNDVLLDGKKVAGVLVEGLFAGETLQAAIVGIGINVNMTKEDLPQLQYPATSLLLEMGATVSREALGRETLRALEHWYLDAKAGLDVHEAWRAQQTMIGARITVSSGAEILNGTAEAVDGDGRLLLRLDDGILVTLIAGDVTLQE